MWIRCLSCWRSYFKKKDSIVAFVASLDNNCTSYYSRVIKNKPGIELADSEKYKYAVSQSFEKYKKVNGHYPKNVIYYRDGVGEGQVKDLLNTEIKTFKEIMNSEKIGGKIGFCYIVVLKKINTRIFCEKDKDRIENPICGTVLDKSITNRGALEFFMISAFVNQGTATPTRYQCLVNDFYSPEDGSLTTLSSDYLQNVTFKLCHLYYNWFGSVRVPAPCIYAHKLAFLVGNHLIGQNEDEKERLSSNLYYL